MSTMYKGVTPPFSFTLPNEVDLTDAESVYVTITNLKHKLLLEKDQDELTIAAHQVDVFLTQQETLAMPSGRILIQLNWTYNQGGQLKRACSDVIEETFKNNLKNEVIA